MAKMIKCKTCGADIAKSAKICPHCGAKKKPGVFRVLMGTFLIFIGLCAIVGALSGGSGSKSPTSDQNAVQAINNSASKQKLEEVSAPAIATGDYGNKTISGSLKNVSGKTISYVQITFALYDNDGAQVGTAVANINNLTADSVWKYSATPLTTNAWTSFEQTEIDSW